jgi:glycosyltransferase involved in cell wall biosynthesis
VIDGMRRVAGRGVDLALVGPDGWNEDLEAKLTRLEGTDVRVHRLGFVPPADLSALYSGCAVFCYPGVREGFGLPVLEAMAQGAAVVTSAGTATEEVAGDAGVLVDPRDHHAVGEALVSVLDDPALAATLRAKARARAATFTWARTAEATAAAYREAAS